MRMKRYKCWHIWGDSSFSWIYYIGGIQSHRLVLQDAQLQASRHSCEQRRASEGVFGGGLRHNHEVQPLWRQVVGQADSDIDLLGDSGV